MANRIPFVNAKIIGATHFLYVEARALHEYLKPSQKPLAWIEGAIAARGYIEEQDYYIDYWGKCNHKVFQVSLLVATELVLTERPDKAVQFRRHTAGSIRDAFARNRSHQCRKRA